MNQYLGSTYSISVFLVLMIVVAFYRAEKPIDPPRQATRSDLAEADLRRPSKIEQSFPDRLIMTSDHVRALSPTIPSSTPEAFMPARASAGKIASPIAFRVSHPRLGPRGAFARVDVGETLADVARRVYGSPGKVDQLWRANRDQLSSPEAPLSAGMLLRTP